MVWKGLNDPSTLQRNPEGGACAGMIRSRRLLLFSKHKSYCAVTVIEGLVMDDVLWAEEPEMMCTHTIHSGDPRFRVARVQLVPQAPVTSAD